MKMKQIFQRTILPLILILGFVTMSFRVNDNSKLFEVTKNLEIFSGIYKELNTHYVDEIDPGHLMKIGIDAMMHSLDPYTVYYSENLIERSKYIAEGRYDGIGVEMKFIDDYMTITELYKGHAADRKELKVGDQITKIADKSTKGMEDEELSLLLKGSMKNDIQLEIYRPIEKRSFTVTLPRDNITTHNVPFKGMVDKEVAYIVLSVFTQNASANIASAFKELKAENPELKYLILDLRGNGGGLLHEAVNICNLFLPSDMLIVSTKGKVKDWDKEYKTNRQPMDLDIPIVVLVDGMSASASEIVSGSLQDYDRAVIMGDRTYGKGLVQNQRKIGYNSGLKLTTAKYYIPSGRCIQSVEYKDGEPVNIPDELRAKFKTENGRTVLDGGGVQPDIYLDKTGNVPLIRELQNQNMIMKFVTEYVNKHPQAPSESDFTFKDFNEFVKFINKEKFTYKTESEKTLEQLEDNLKNESYYKDVSKELNNIRKETQKIKDNSLSRYEREITDLIEEEIMSRFYYQNGKIKQRLKNDKEVDAAIELLKDQKKYNKILKKS